MHKLDSIFFVKNYYLTRGRQCVIMAGRARVSRPEFTIIPPAAHFVKQKLFVKMHKDFPETLYTLPIVISKGICYIIIVKGRCEVRTRLSNAEQ